MFKAISLVALGATAVIATPYKRFDANNGTDILPSGTAHSTGTHATGAFGLPRITHGPKTTGTHPKVSSNATITPVVHTSLNATSTSLASLPANATGSGVIPSQTSVFEHSGFNFTLNPVFNATGNWTQMKCSDSKFQQPNVDGQELWLYAGADQALEQLLAAWNSPERPKVLAGYTFSRFVWAMFHQTGGSTIGVGANCADVLDQVCSNPISCDDSIAPAGYLIINSMVALNHIYQMQYNGLEIAYSDISGAMQLVVDNFDWSPKQNNDMEIFEIILDVLSIGLGAVGGAEISAAFNAIKVFGQMAEKTAETVKKISTAGLKITSTVLKSLNPPQKQAEITPTLNALLDFGKDGLTSSVASMLASLTEANGQENQTMFSDLMNTGLMLDYSNQGSPNKTTDLADAAVGLLYGQAIPAAWSLDTDGLRPFILRMDAKDGKCGSDLPSGMSNYFDSNVAKDALWCDASGNSFWLLNGVHTDPVSAGRFGGGGHQPNFKLLPGGNTTNLDGKNWGGLKLSDIIASSWGGFMANNKMNGYSIPEGTNEQVADNMTLQSGGLPMSGGLRTPGYINLTICLDYTEAVKTLQGSDKSAPICGTQPSPGDSQTDLNKPGAYTPGWCKIHVEQWQRNEGNENPLNVYQMSVNIFDSASLLIGSATKQPAGNPLAIADSVLPYQLIVAPGAGDDDPVEIWYADQYFDTNSAANQCSVGKFDSGTRQIDCGFQCPLPPSSPAVSATVGHKLPGTPTPASGGATTFVNTYITPTPTPTPSKNAPPPPAPTPTYATGWCGVHVVQYQKNEKSSGNQPNYQIEVTLYDAKQKAIGDSGMVGAQTNQGVNVKGLVSDFLVSVGSVDSDPVSFNFTNHETWDSNSKSCSPGKYDSGYRNMDCGFTC